ncbi:hypothetical protein TNCV_4770881 [Trichonephila clavipes]|nr:hypothetical protein TNCV_4770881 [Trichonephila clavipes]
MVVEPLVRNHTPITTVNELFYRVEISWSSVPIHAIQSLFDSMPRRISAVITARDKRPLRLRSTTSPYLVNHMGPINRPATLALGIPYWGAPALQLCHLPFSFPPSQFPDQEHVPKERRILCPDGSGHWFLGNPRLCLERNRDI